MKDITHKILSEVHHLLSIATETELRRAGGLKNMSTHLRTALNSLAAERASMGETGDRDLVVRLLSRKSSDAKKHHAKSNLTGMAREIAKSLEKLSKSEIQEACQAVGLIMPVKPKEARGRLIRRVVRLVVQMPEEDRNRLLSTMRVASDSQTEGWVGVIRKGQ